jgi:sulfocyanin
LAIGVFVLAGAMATGMSGVRAAPHSVELTIVAGKIQSGAGSLDFNGYQRGGMTVTVPVGWEVVVHFENADAALPHSLAVLAAGAHQQPAPPDSPVFPGAATAKFHEGFPKGGKQTLTFEASKAGTYDLLCGVQGHAVAGAWSTLVVSATAAAPSVTPPAATALTVK